MARPPSGTAAHIKIKRKPPPAPVPGYRALLAGCGTNKNDQAVAFIIACIGDGLNTRSQILGMGDRCGLNSRHLAVMLIAEMRGEHSLPRWRIDDRGILHLLD